MVQDTYQQFARISLLHAIHLAIIVKNVHYFSNFSKHGMFTLHYSKTKTIMWTNDYEKG